jgi:rare lipoprotein A
LTPTGRILASVAATFLLSAGLSPAHAGLPLNWEESGQASWYGPGFHGHRTSSGESFNERAMTAAHDTLPLGTRVLVTTQETGRSVLVTITDRLPPKHLRIIDVSRGAAAKLGLLGSGVGMVTLSTPPAAEVIEVAEAPEDLGDDDAVANPRRHGLRHTHRAVRRASAYR